MNFYNEIDPLKAEVLREAIKAGAIAPGVVDERSIADVKPDELVEYIQCHFFAGGGFWSLALRLAGWPDDEPVWTGSCPCPSFSNAGKGGGFDDPRHLWPDWDKLIDKRRPPVVFGEQVASAIRFGWLDLVQSDMERKGYAVGKAVFGACSVGAPHIRQRLYFVADTESGGSGSGLCDSESGELRGVLTPDGSGFGELVQSFSAGLEGHSGDGDHGNQPGRIGAVEVGSTSATSEPSIMADAHDAQRRSDGASGNISDRQASERNEGHGDAGHGGPVGGFWGDAEWIPCRNPKVPGGVEWRPIKPGTFCLANGSPARVGRLRLYGDGIVVTAAQAFIEAYIETRKERGVE